MTGVVVADEVAVDEAVDVTDDDAVADGVDDAVDVKDEVAVEDCDDVAVEVKEDVAVVDTDVVAVLDSDVVAVDVYVDVAVWLCVVDAVDDPVVVCVLFLHCSNLPAMVSSIASLKWSTVSLHSSAFVDAFKKPFSVQLSVASKKDGYAWTSNIMFNVNAVDWHVVLWSTTGI